ncbi:MAG: nucleoside 2-deoxyribosyltransferase [Hyphomicrobiaceae bacterium]
MPEARMKRVYLAGPEVFLPNAMDVGMAKVELAREAGFAGLFPLDQQLDLAGLSKLEQARRISLANEALMRSADLLIANLTPFRGVSMDSGTAFEVGFMRALGRPVLGYTNVQGDYRGRAEAFRRRGIPPADSDAPDFEIEDFGMAENLMIAVAILESGGRIVEGSAPAGSEMADLTAFRQCLDEAHRLLLV